MAKPTPKSVQYAEKSSFLLALSFIEGGAVMGVELIGAKMIEPFFGSSLYVWSSVLAMTLLGLTFGYYVGGIVSEKYPKAKTLYFIIIGAAIFTAFMPLVGPGIMEKSLGMDVRMGSIVSSLLFIFPPLALFGMVSPIIIRRLTSKIEATGRKAGLVYAISTIGGILFTFLVGFYLIPEMGLRVSAFIVAGFLVILPLVYFVQNKMGLALTAAVIVLASSSMFAYSIYKDAPPKTGPVIESYASDGMHGRLTVQDFPNSDTRCLYTNHVSLSYIHVPSKRSQWTYVHRLATYASFIPEGAEVFLAGLGAGNVVGEFDILGFETDVVEIDPRMPEVAKQFFFFEGARNMMIDDARHAIRTSEKKYDLVVLDVSAGEAQPNNLYTIEGFKDIQKIMKDGAFLFIHYPSYSSKEKGLAVRSIAKTMESAGFYVEFLDTKPKPDNVDEHILFANLTKTSINSKDFSRRDAFAKPFNFPVTGKLTMDYDISDGIIMTDNMPIMDRLHMHNAQYYRKGGIDITVKAMRSHGIEIL